MSIITSLLYHEMQSGLLTLGCWPSWPWPTLLIWNMIHLLIISGHFYPLAMGFSVSCTQQFFGWLLGELSLAPPFLCLGSTLSYLLQSLVLSGQTTYGECHWPATEPLLGPLPSPRGEAPSCSYSPNPPYLYHPKLVFSHVSGHSFNSWNTSCSSRYFSMDLQVKRCIGPWRVTSVHGSY